jgi:hypothetical protein
MLSNPAASGRLKTRYGSQQHQITIHILLDFGENGVERGEQEGTGVELW